VAASRCSQAHGAVDVKVHVTSAADILAVDHVGLRLAGGNKVVGAGCAIAKEASGALTADATFAVHLQPTRRVRV
jgi:hypothetical protein